jgi:CheY-like chemotaxis protein
MEPKTILLAEDDPSHVELFRQAMIESGIAGRLVVVEDGTEVIDYLFCSGKYTGRAGSDTPDLILLDIKMPRMSGLQVLQVLRRVHADERTQMPPVVVMTGSDDDRDVIEAYKRGAQGYVRKPVDFNTYARTVRETLQYWLEVNRPMPRFHFGVQMMQGL